MGRGSPTGGVAFGFFVVVVGVIGSNEGLGPGFGLTPEVVNSYLAFARVLELDP